MAEKKERLKADIEERRKKILSMIANGYASGSIMEKLEIPPRTYYRDMAAMSDHFMKERVKNANRAVLEFLQRCDKRQEILYSKLKEAMEEEEAQKKANQPVKKTSLRILKQIHDIDESIIKTMQTMGVAPRAAEEFKVTNVNNPFAEVLKKYGPQTKAGSSNESGGDSKDSLQE